MHTYTMHACMRANVHVVSDSNKLCLVYTAQRPITQTSNNITTCTAYAHWVSHQEREQVQWMEQMMLEVTPQQMLAYVAQQQQMKD